MSTIHAVLWCSGLTFLVSCLIITAVAIAAVYGGEAGAFLFYMLWRCFDIARIVVLSSALVFVIAAVTFVILHTLAH